MAAKLTPQSTRLERLTLWIAIAGLGVALFGGIPGLFQIYQAVTSKPDLQVRVETIWVGRETMRVSDRATGQEHLESGTVVMTQLLVINRHKEPTTLTRYQMIASDAGGRSVRAQHWAIPRDFSVDEGSATIHFNKADLVEIASQTPLEHRRQIRGWLKFRLADPEWAQLLKIPGAKVTVSVIDADGTEFKGFYQRGDNTDGIRYVPGAGMQLKPVPYSSEPRK